MDGTCLACHLPKYTDSLMQTMEADSSCRAAVGGIVSPALGQHHRMVQPHFTRLGGGDSSVD